LIPRKPDDIVCNITVFAHWLFFKVCLEINCKLNSYRAELEEWLRKRGKTPSGFRHLRCFDATLSAKKKLHNPNHDNGSGEVVLQITIPNNL
jgi:hypothetical protein